MSTENKSRIARWTAIHLTAITTVGGLIWFVAGMQSDVTANTNRITEVRQRVDSHDQQLDGINRKLDRAIVILERLDQKLGQP